MRFVLTLFLLCLATICNAKDFTGKVVGITDGDTITVLDDENSIQKVRVAGIDAPEKNQAFGQRSKQSLSELVFSKVVTVQTNKRDRYERHVGKILLDGQDINLEQVRRGMAWHYKAYEQEQSPEDRRKYADAEDKARKARIGLWRDAAPVPPWKFRRHER